MKQTINHNQHTTPPGLNSLGLARAPADTRVVVAMSGGVDSSVTAAMLARQGYDVIGITLQLYDHGVALEKSGACCAGQDIYDARRVSEAMGFPHYVLDYESRFRHDVIDDFADAYLRGETPIPCARCNQTVKFRDLLAQAHELDADILATGHYIKRLEGEKGPELHRATDEGKDQSYFLFATTREQLKMLRFPLGGWPKFETRAMAIDLGLHIADKPDSQDICFVPDGNYAKLVSKLRPGAIDPGHIVHVDGRIVGQHEGIINYTIGQRRGLGIGGEVDPLYVVRLDPAAKQVIVGPKSALARNIVHLKQINWLGHMPLSPDGEKIRVKLRSAMQPILASLHPGPQDTAEVWLEQPHHGIAPGQACVFYRGSRLMGGGWIVGAETRIAELENQSFLK